MNSSKTIANMITTLGLASALSACTGKSQLSYDELVPDIQAQVKQITDPALEYVPNYKPRTVFRVTLTNTGNEELSDVYVTGHNMHDCDSKIDTLGVKQQNSYTCIEDIGNISGKVYKIIYAGAMGSETGQFIEDIDFTSVKK